jgi:hypothetical protein
MGAAVSEFKAMTVRLPAQLAAELDTVALVDELPVAEVIRIAVAERVNRRRADPAFRQALGEHIARQQAMLDRP